MSAEGRELGNQAGKLVIGEVAKFIFKLESICSDLLVLSVDVYFQTGKHMFRPVSVSVDDCPFYSN